MSFFLSRILKKHLFSPPPPPTPTVHSNCKSKMAGRTNDRELLALARINKTPVLHAKRKVTARYLKNKTQENWELRRRTRNAATKQRRIAMKGFWRKKTEDLKNNPKCFHKTFKPFLSTKNCTKGEEIL